MIEGSAHEPGHEPDPDAAPAHDVGWQATVTRQLAFGAAALPDERGARWLDDHGRADPSRGIHTWITARMAHVFSLGTLLAEGSEDSDDSDRAGDDPAAEHRELARRAVAALAGPLHDDEHGGWFAGLDADGAPAQGGTKAAYPHAFVLLAAASAATAGVEGAEELLAGVTRTVDERFVDGTGLPVDRWDRGFSHLAGYRGVNATMHLLEASLAAWDVAADPRHLDRAVAAATPVVAWAAEREWRVPEHFTAPAWGAAWTETPEHHRDEPDHPFEPYGATVGHGLEWSRLVLQLDAALAAAGRPPVLDAVIAARGLYDRAVSDGWSRDGADGFVYTTDWSGAPVVRTRMHWVVAEAVCAAASLAVTTGDPRYAEDLAAWRAHAVAVWEDPATGTWAHERSPDLGASATVWQGRPDLYHTVHAALLPELPPAPTAARALAERAALNAG